MTPKRRAQQRLRDLLATLGGEVDPSVRADLEALPPGWAKVVGGMMAQTEQILTDTELAIFRWTSVRIVDGRLAAAWTGTEESSDLVEQIVETAAAETAQCCTLCGQPALHAAFDQGAEEPREPRCTLHAGLKAVTAGWKSRASDLKTRAGDLKQSIHDLAARVPATSGNAAKAVASALPALMSEAQAYFRTPDGDAAPLLRQIRKALRQLDKDVRRSVGVSLMKDTP